MDRNIPVGSIGHVRVVELVLFPCLSEFYKHYICTKFITFNKLLDLPIKCSPYNTGYTFENENVTYSIVLLSITLCHFYLDMVSYAFSKQWK